MMLAVNSSPHTLRAGGVTRVMLLVLLACVPAWLTFTWFFGWGLTINIVIGTCTALLLESIVMKLRSRPVLACLRDSSAIVTAVLLAFATPPGAPWWIPVLGASLAVIVGKQVYGGLGHNIFNPAMVGYVALLIAFPLHMTGWNIPGVQSIEGVPIDPLGLQGLLISLSVSFPFLPIEPPRGLDVAIDGFSAATPLLFYKLAAQSSLLDQLQSGGSLLDRSAETGWEMVSIAFALGGLFLLWKRVITWHIPLSIMATLLALSCGFYFLVPGGHAIYGSPILHMFGTATMIGAFLIATDPVSAPASSAGKLLYGALIGVLMYSIRVWGSYLDSVGIAVILANAAAPLFDLIFRQRLYGEQHWWQRLLPARRAGRNAP